MIDAKLERTITDMSLRSLKQHGINPNALIAKMCSKFARGRDFIETCYGNIPVLIDEEVDDEKIAWVIRRIDS
jgi:hypothetical protein